METDKMPVLTVSGNPLERGRMIGEALRQDIRTVLEKARTAIERGRGYRSEDYFAAFDLYADYKTAVSKWAPGLMLEVQGIAEGAAIDFDELFRLQLLDEDWFFDAYHYRATARVHNKCTAFGIAGSADEATYAGQNMDIMSLVEGHQVLLRIQYDDSELESLVFTHAGLIGLCGMNNSPLGVTCNTLMQLGSCSNGLPVAFITRSLLAMSSFDEALLFLNKIRHASGQTYTLSTKGRVGAFECSPHQVVEYRPRSDGRKVVHTNHPLANDDTATYRELAEADPGGSWVRGEGNTRSRLASIAARTLNNDKGIELPDLKSALSARDDPENPVCRDLSVDGSSGTNDSANPIAFTAGSMIYEYGEKFLLHLAAGPPGQSEFQVFEFTR